MTASHGIEAAAAVVGLRLLRALSPSAASDLGGAVARMIGPLLPVSQVADQNLARALPELDAAARRRIVRGVWDNLGRTAAELPHVGRLERTASGPGWEISDDDAAFCRELAANGGPVLLYSGHIGNWELWPTVARSFGISLGLVYRPASNGAVDRIINDLRGDDVPMFAKGASGARDIFAFLARGGYLAILVDQKLNDGIAVDFFGRPAMTAPAIAALALRFRCPVVPAYAERIGPARFRIRVGRPMALPDGADRTANILAIMRAINGVLEGWIREKPEAWLWLHRRWPKPD